jgi:hypothetical protein
MGFGPREIGIIYLVLVLLWLGSAVFIISLAWRFVKAFERIASVMERRHGTD